MTRFSATLTLLGLATWAFVLARREHSVWFFVIGLIFLIAGMAEWFGSENRSV